MKSHHRVAPGHLVDDPFFELAEVLSWMRTMPRMEAHVLDAGHKLLETHAAAAVPLMLDFIRRSHHTPERTAAAV